MHLVPDGSTGGIRISSAAFDDSRDGSPMSVDLEKEMLRWGKNADSTLQGFEGFALASLCAGVVRSLNQGVFRDPLPDNPAHALVFGEKTKSVRKKMAKQAAWAVPPPDNIKEMG